MKKGLFITGTSTDVGKTWISAMIMAAATSHQFPLSYFKPLQTGDCSDCESVKKLANVTDDRIIAPVFSFKPPQAVIQAAKAEGRSIDVPLIVSHFQKHNQTPILVEGAGGLLHPIAKNYYIRDLIKAFDLPLLIVASTQLGTMNHTLLTVESALNAQIPVKGVIFSGHSAPGLVDTLTPFLPVPILKEVPWLEPVSMQYFQQFSATFFPPALLEELFS